MLSIQVENPVGRLKIRKAGEEEDVKLPHICHLLKTKVKCLWLDFRVISMLSFKSLALLHVHLFLIHAAYREPYITTSFKILLTSHSCVNHYCKSTNFGVLLYLANLANCVSSLIFVAANIYVDRTLHRRAARRRQI